MREIALSGGEPPLRVYDTSGPQGFDVRRGLPSLRGEWIRARDVKESRVTSHESRHPRPDSRLATRDRGGESLIPETLRRPGLRGQRAITQLHFARAGQITAETEFIALREGMPAEFVRSEV
ncbi:MAG TPA: phosphomethylpyrimidine synthase ThiC, partial [Chloroflexota bacterium]